MRVCLEYLRRSLFSRGGIRLEQTVIFLRNVMIFLKVPVGMRKIATLTMEKTVRGGTTIDTRYRLDIERFNALRRPTDATKPDGFQQ